MKAAIGASAVHHHHWVIEQPTGRWSTGVCKHCRAGRTFENWTPEADYTTREERGSADPSAPQLPAVRRNRRRWGTTNPGQGSTPD